LISSKTLRRKRKYAILLVFVIAAFFTPPDVVTQGLMAIPLLILYEISIWVVKAGEKDRAPEEDDEEDEDDTEVENKRDG